MTTGITLEGVLAASTVTVLDQTTEYGVKEDPVKDQRRSKFLSTTFYLMSSTAYSLMSRGIKGSDKEPAMKIQNRLSDFATASVYATLPLSMKYTKELLFDKE